MKAQELVSVLKAGLSPDDHENLGRLMAQVVLYKNGRINEFTFKHQVSRIIADSNQQLLPEQLWT